MPDWSRPLPQPLTVGRRKLRTLDDVRRYVVALPKERGDLPMWQNVADALFEAANGGKLSGVIVAFKLAKTMDREPD